LAVVFVYAPIVLCQVHPDIFAVMLSHHTLFYYNLYVNYVYKTHLNYK
jgi:hypothetical protein